MRAEPRRTHVGAAVAIIVVSTAVGGVAGYGGTLLKSPIYTSTAQLSWDPSSLRYTNSTAYVPDSVTFGVQMQKLSLEVLSDDVVDPAAKALNTTAAQIRQDVTVKASSDTTQIAISANASTPARAQSVVSELVDEFDNQVTKTLSDQYTKQAADLQGPIDALKQQQASASGSLADNLGSQVGTLAAQQVVLRAQADDVSTPLSTVRAAPLPSTPSGATATTLAVVGAGLGFLIGLGIFALTVSLRRNKRRSVRPTESARVRPDFEAA